MKILVTGHTGLLGQHLVKELKDHDVVGASLTTGNDLRDKEATQKLLDEVKPELVYMLAANPYESRAQKEPVDMVDNNIVIFTNTLTASINAGVKKFIYTSSSAVYGDAPAPQKEGGPTTPKDVYGVNKLACERILKIMAKTYGIRFTIVRPHSLYGEGQDINDLHRNVVSIFMRKLLLGETCTLNGGGRVKRTFSYAPDVAKALARLSGPRYDGMVINLGATQSHSIRELYETLCDVTGIEGKMEIKGDRLHDIVDSTLDHTLQKSLWVYKETLFVEGLKKTWEWAKTQKITKPIVKSDEIRSNNISV